MGLKTVVTEHKKVTSSLHDFTFTGPSDLINNLVQFAFIGFALLPFVTVKIGPDNSHHFLIQSEVKPKSIVTYLC